MKTTPTLMALLLLAFSCGSPCDDAQVITKDQFSIIYSGYIPYKGYDTLTFLKNSKDTIMLINNHGRNEFYETVYVGQGECSVKHRLKHHVYDFYSQTNNLKFTAHYFIYTENQGFIDMYEAKINDAPIIKPVDANLAVSGTPIPTMLVLGVEHYSVFFFTNIGNDSLYIRGDADPTKIVRIKHLNDVYEILP
jgi:hypothetical protein